MCSYIFNSLKRDNSNEIAKTINLLYDTDKPVIVCVGSDLVVGDSLGPIVGTKLNEKLNGKAFVYGTLLSPVTAKEIPVIQSEIKKLHPFSKILVVDAAIGIKDEIGYIKIANQGIKPGLGVDKDLPFIGDVCVIGIVSNKKENNFNYTTRFSLIYSLVNDIVSGLVKAFN